MITRSRRVGVVACTSKIDLLFVVDASGSIQFERMKSVREFLVSIVADLDVGPTSTRVGAVYFSNESHTAFTLDQYNSRQDVQEAIRYIPYLGGRTNIAAGLRLARTHLLQATDTTLRSTFVTPVRIITRIGLCSVLRPRQHSIHVGYTGDGFYRSKDPTNSIKVLKKHIDYTINTKNTISTHINTKHSKST